MIHREAELGNARARAAIANVSVLRIDEGDFELSDGFETIAVTQRLDAGRVRARGSVDRGRVKPAPVRIRAAGDGRPRSSQQLRERRGRQADRGRAEPRAADGDATGAAHAARRRERSRSRRTSTSRSDGVSGSAPATRHRRLETDPVIARGGAVAARRRPRFIGYPAIRARGTIGGSLAHADPVGGVARGAWSRPAAR